MLKQIKREIKNNSDIQSNKLMDSLTTINNPHNFARYIQFAIDSKSSILEYITLYLSINFTESVIIETSSNYRAYLINFKNNTINLLQITKSSHILINKNYTLLDDFLEKHIKDCKDYLYEIYEHEYTHYLDTNAY